MAERFGVSAASVSRWRSYSRCHGDIRSGPLCGDRRFGRIEADADTIQDFLEATPDIPIQELRLELSQIGLAFGYGTIQRFLIRNDVTRKKTTHTTEQDRFDVLKRRGAWFEMQPELDPVRLVFID